MDKINRKDSCVVYSFGIATDWSFDDEMAMKGCEVHAFDPTLDLTSTFKRMEIKGTGAAKFHMWGLGGGITDTIARTWKGASTKTSQASVVRKVMDRVRETSFWSHRRRAGGGARKVKARLLHRMF